MFGRNYNPEDLADRLSQLVMPSGAMHVAAYYKFMRPDDDERIRILFNLLLLPLALSYPTIQTTTNTKLAEAIRQSHEVYLRRIREADQLVDIGRYVVWNFEREAIAHELRERFCQLIVPSAFDGHQMQYGMLVRVASDVRNRTVWTDFNFGMSQAGGDSKWGLTLAFGAMAASFTKRVFKIDLAAVDLDPVQKDRFQQSIALASAFHAHGFFALTELLKKIGS
jgi:hypothetical protein